MADVAADALVVVGVHITTGGGLVLLDLEHGDLRAVDHAVVALEALAAAHAALGLGLGLGFHQGLQALVEVAQGLFGREVGDGALVAWREGEVAEEELLVRDDVAVGAVVVVVDGHVAAVGAADGLVHLADDQALLDHLALEVEGVHVDLGALLQCLAAEEAVDAVGRDGAVADGRGQQVRADDVAAGKHAGVALHLVVLVGRHRALAVVEHLQAGEVHRLADGRDDQVGRDVFLRALDVLDLQLAAGDLGLAADHAQGGGAAVGAAHHADRRVAAADGDAFGQGVLDLVPGGLHLVDREDGGQRHLGALLGRDRGDVVRHVAGNGVLGAVAGVDLVDVAQATGHGGHVDGGVTAADHHHALAHVAQAAVVEGLEEGGGGHAVGCVGAFDRQCAARLGAHAEEHRVEILVDLLHGDVGADACLHFRGHAQVQDALDLGVQDVARRAEARDAVAHHAAEFLAFVEDGDRVALEGELVGHRQAGRAAADDGHLLAGGEVGRGEGQIVGDGVFAEEVLDRVDADEVFHLVAVAARFTGCRADAAHDGGEGVGLGQAAEGVFLPLHAGRRLLDAAHDVQVTADVLARGAAALAGRRALDVGRALVRVVGVEDLLLPGTRRGVAVLVAPEGDGLDADGFGVG